MKVLHLIPDSFLKEINVRFFSEFPDIETFLSRKNLMKMNKKQMMYIIETIEFHIKNTPYGSLFEDLPKEFTTIENVVNEMISVLEEPLMIQTNRSLNRSKSQIIQQNMFEENEIDLDASSDSETQLINENNDKNSSSSSSSSQSEISEEIEEKKTKQIKKPKTIKRKVSKKKLAKEESSDDESVSNESSSSSESIQKRKQKKPRKVERPNGFGLSFVHDEDEENKNEKIYEMESTDDDSDESEIQPKRITRGMTQMKITKKKTTKKKVNRKESSESEEESYSSNESSSSTSSSSSEEETQILQSPTKKQWIIPSKTKKQTTQKIEIMIEEKEENNENKSFEESEDDSEDEYESSEEIYHHFDKKVGIPMEMIEEEIEPMNEIDETFGIPQRNDHFILPFYFFQSQHPLYQINEIVSCTKKSARLYKPIDYNENQSCKYYLRLVDNNGKDAFTPRFWINNKLYDVIKPDHFIRPFEVHYTMIPFEFDFNETNFYDIYTDEAYINIVIMKCQQRTINEIIQLIENEQNKQDVIQQYQTYIQQQKYFIPIQEDENEVIITKIIKGNNDKNQNQENMEIEIKEENKNENIENEHQEQEIIPFNCPIGGSKIEIPVKSEQCLHNKCYCLHNLLEICFYSNIWNCPICGKQCYFSDIEFNSRINNFLESLKLKGSFIGLTCISDTMMIPTKNEEENDMSEETEKEEQFYLNRKNKE